MQEDEFYEQKQHDEVNCNLEAEAVHVFIWNPAKTVNTIIAECEIRNFRILWIFWHMKAAKLSSVIIVKLAMIALHHEK